MLNCRQATELMSAQQDRDLAWGESTQLKVHVAMCAACRCYSQQMVFLRNTMRTFANREDPPQQDEKAP